MREPAGREIKKDIVLSKCFIRLTEKGIEAVTVKDFSEATGMASSSIYYWFEDKDEIVLDAVEWGMNEYVRIVFDYALEHTEDIIQLCKGIKELAQVSKKQFRVIFQVATSPQYGGSVRKFSDKLDLEYERYTKILSEKLNLDFNILYPFVSLFISVFIDCVIWDSWDKYDMEVATIIKALIQEG